MEAGGTDPSPPLTAADEETVKRNTDCVYFLASPLTCKKGSECEFRHSQGARVNPRDCWYWLNGNCLNPKCLFRHPPLDGLLGTPTTTPLEPSLPPSQTATSIHIPAAHTPVSHTSNKQGVPCYYFQKGICLKGDRCPFMHGLQPTANPIAQQVPKVATPVIGPPHPSKGMSGGLEKCTTQQINPKISFDKPVEVNQSLAKLVAEAEKIQPTNGLTVKSNILTGPLVNEIRPRSQPANVAVSSNVLTRSRGRQAYLPDQHFQNGREVGEFLKDSSPGFHVRADVEHKNPDYFHSEHEFGDTSGLGERTRKPGNDFDHRHSSDDGSLSKFGKEPYNEVGEYDDHGRVRNCHGREHRRSSSERIIERSSTSERRGVRKEVRPEGIDGSDLRHRLLKQRRLNEPRSASSSDHRSELHPRDDQYVEEQGYHNHNSFRDQRHFTHGNTISNRLQGRIILPGRSPSNNPRDLRSEREIDKGRSCNPSNLNSEREMDRGRNWDRSSSPVGPTNVKGRLSNRIKHKIHEDITPEARNSGTPLMRRDEVETLNFAGPKSLAELKGAKASDNSEVRLVKNDNSTLTREQKNMLLGKALGGQGPESSLVFEAPKPLSVILKRKRESVPGNGAVSSSGDENDQRDAGGDAGGPRGSMISVTYEQSSHLLDAEKEGDQTVSNIEELNARAVEEEGEEGLIFTDEEELPHPRDGSMIEVTNEQSSHLLDAEKEGDQIANKIEEPKARAVEEEEEEGLIFTDGEELPHEDQSSFSKREMLETEDGMMVDNMEDPELENYDQMDGEYDFEADDGAEFKTEDDEIEFQEDEELDDEDADDFARKHGILFS